MENLDYSDVRKFWEGQKHMPWKVCEECDELIQAISKYEQYRYASISTHTPSDFYAVMSNLKDEIRDIYIMMGALCDYYNIDLKEVKWDVKTKMLKEKDTGEFV